MKIDTLNQIRRFAAEQCLNIYNDIWREDNEPKLAAVELAAQLKNPSIVLYDELGSAAIYFEDSNLFSGHSIEVFVTDHRILNASTIG